MFVYLIYNTTENVKCIHLLSLFQLNLFATCFIHYILKLFHNRRAIRLMERVISANYFMRKWSDVLIETAICIFTQNMDVMLLFLCCFPKREMINCKHVLLKVFGKYSDSQKLYVKTSPKHRF